MDITEKRQQIYAAAAHVEKVTDRYIGHLLP